MPGFCITAEFDVSTKKNEKKSTLILHFFNSMWNTEDTVKKGSFYTAQYPVRWTAQSALHFLPYNRMNGVVGKLQQYILLL